MSNTVGNGIVKEKFVLQEKLNETVKKIKFFSILFLFDIFLLRFKRTIFQTA